MQSKVYILSWPSGVGKTTVWDILLKENDLGLKKIITTTTRNKREWEIDWLDYYFLNKENFQKKIEDDEFIEYAIVHDNYYWSTYDELDNILRNNFIALYIVDPQWAIFLKEKLKNKYDIITFFLLPPSEEDLKQRLLDRWTETEESFNIRFDESLEQMKQKNNYDFCIVNSDLKKTIEDFKKIIIN